MSEKTKTSALKIGLLTSDLSHQHGWAHYSLSLIQALNRAGVNLTVIATEDSPDVEGMAVHKLLPSGMSIGYRSLLRQAKLLPRVRALLSDCDVIHATVEPFAPLAAWVAGERPLFITGHGTYVRAWGGRPLVDTLYRRAFLRARLVCVSSYTARVARETLPNANTIVVNNGINLERFAGKSPDSIMKRGPTVLAVGAVKARKGTLELVRAMNAVRREMPDVQCIIIGSLDSEPAYTAQVKTAIQKLDLAQTVHLFDHAPETTLMGWYQAADVFALPSMNVGRKFEGYGLVYLEASAEGLPVIGTTGCGAEDAIVHGVTGLLIPQEQIAERLPEAILHILRDPALAAKMGAAGRAKAAGQTWNHVVAQMIAMYNEQCWSRLFQ